MSDVLTEPEAPVASKKAAVGTAYVVLAKRIENGQAYWLLINPVREARSAAAAVRQVAEKEGEGTYVAVPERSWHPITVKVETKTQLTFS